MRIRKRVKEVVHSPGYLMSALLLGLLLQEGVPPIVTKYGTIAIQIVLYVLFVIGIVALGLMAIDMVLDYRRLRKSGSVTREVFMVNFKGDLWLMFGAAVIVLIPAAAFLNWDTAQGIINRVLGAAEEI